MTPEWIAVPTTPMRRWLALELARSLGASGPGTADGIAANINFGSPDSLRQIVLAAGRAGEGDPWYVQSLVWAVLEVLRSNRFDEGLGPLTRLAPGATWFGRARRLADMFDRYSVRRPDLVLHWAAGRDLDGTGRPLAEHDKWQPHLWRLVRERIGVPSPPERLPGLLGDVRVGAVALELPPRLSVFGLTTLPSGAPFLELLEAVACRHEVHLLLLDPSPATTSRVRQASRAKRQPLTRLRADDLSDAEVRQVSHPLLRSWGRPYRERTVLLAAAESGGIPAPAPLDEPGECGEPVGKSLLARLQHDLRAGLAPAGDFEPDPADRSVQVHSCHGQARQVQVLRDAICHLLADDPSLREDDIVVLSPAIDQFAPLVLAGFGTSVEQTEVPAGQATPRLSYRITDRSLRESYPALAAIDSLLALVSGRFGASEVMEFLSLPVVRRRFGLDDDGLRTIAGWVEAGNVRWGLDGPQRAPWGLPPEFSANTWRSVLDRVLMGVAVSDDRVGLAPGEIAPLAVESGQIADAGRLAEFIGALMALFDDFKRDRPVAAWCAALSDALSLFFVLEETEQWQLDQLRRVIAEIDDQAIVGDEPSTVELSLQDVRRLLSDRLQGRPARSEFFRGGITVSSLTPLRWLPFRVVCLLGLDETGTSGAGAVDGDDLAAISPFIGDRDPRAEVRQALLEAILAAEDHLVITRTGHNIRTNREVPAATVLAELRDAITSTLSPADQGDHWGRIETVHPCQPFDDRCFSPGELNVPGPWSFDAGAFEGALARQERTVESHSFLEGPLPAADFGPVIALADLRSFFNHPVKAFLKQRLQLHLLGEEDEPSDEFVTSLDNLENWAVAERLLEARLAGHSTAEWERHERALGTLPPGVLGDDVLVAVGQAIDDTMAAAQALSIDPALNDRLQVDVELAQGRRVVGTILGRCAGLSPGPALLTCSKLAPKRRLAAWLDLVALVATDPATNWRSVVVGKPDKGGAAATLELVARGDTPAERRRVALGALEVAVDCYLRGMREPVPLFSSYSYKLHKGNAGPGDWRPYGGHGDGDEEANRLAFGDLSHTEIRDLEARDDDPPGSDTQRAARFAHYLWGAVEASCEESG